MLAEQPVCRARFVTARSVAVKCYGLVNLYDRIAGCGQSRAGPLPAGGIIRG